MGEPPSTTDDDRAPAPAEPELPDVPPPVASRPPAALAPAAMLPPAPTPDVSLPPLVPPPRGAVLSAPPVCNTSPICESTLPHAASAMAKTRKVS
jgi:hypothetical protein